MNKNELRIIDNADTVCTRLKVLARVLHDVDFETFSMEEIVYSHMFLEDVISECVDMLSPVVSAEVGDSE